MRKSTGAPSGERTEAAAQSMEARRAAALARAITLTPIPKPAKASPEEYELKILARLAAERQPAPDKQIEAGANEIVNVPSEKAEELLKRAGQRLLEIVRTTGTTFVITSDGKAYFVGEGPSTAKANHLVDLMTGKSDVWIEMGGKAVEVKLFNPHPREAQK